MIFESIGRLLLESDAIAIICHRNPDGDSLGSAIGLHLALQKLHKRSTPLCIDPVPDVFRFLPRSDEVLSEFDPEEYDLYVFVDTADIEVLSGYYTKYKSFFLTRRTINIDHHPSNKYFASLNHIDAGKASTTMIIYELLRYLRIPIDSKIATCLLTGIITDTGGFQHSNTDHIVYNIASNLLDCGAQQTKIFNSVFKSKTIPTLKLWGKVLRDMRLENNKQIVWTTVMKKDFEEYGAGQEDLSGVINLMYAIPEVKVAVLLTEQEDGKIKASIRTKNGADANQFASFFGGGGHKKAAGFVIQSHAEQ